MSACEQDEDARLLWWSEAIHWPASDLVFVDESGCNTTLRRLFGRSLRGERCRGKAPRNWKENLTIIGALSLHDWQAMTLSGACDRHAFESFIQDVLCPNLRVGQIVIMDNLSVHRSSRAQELIEEAGCRLVFLPPYSPDFNPIEMMWSKVKALIRKIAARTMQELEDAVATALHAVSHQDAKGWFGNVGYD